MHTTSLPSGFPRSFPLPVSAAITGWRVVRSGLAVGGVEPSRGAGSMSGALGTIVTVVMPSPDFMSTVRALARGLPGAGYAVLRSEAEPPSDAEADFEGHGYLGRWALFGLPTCPRAVSLSIFVEPR